MAEFHGVVALIAVGAYMVAAWRRGRGARREAARRLYDWKQRGGWPRDVG